MKIATIAIIGGGNMGASLLGGLISNHYPAENIWLAGPTKEKLQHIQRQCHVNVTVNNAEAIQAADVVIFAVKGQVLADIASELKSIIQAKQPLVISVAAGFREQNLQRLLGGSIPIIRAMPNTPSLIGCGASALYANAFVSSDQRNVAESILRSVGIIVWLADERQLDAVTALSGCGPAYYFYLSEILQEAAEKLGLTPEVARLLTLQTALGAAKMALESDETVIHLRHRVTSPGGATERAIDVLEKENMRSVFSKALQAAKLRAEELAETLGNPHD